jgi:uncharacterized protein YciI
MLFAAICTDKPGSVQLRLDNRPAHVDYLNSLGAKLRAAGALLSPVDQNPVGSLLIYEAESVDEAQALVDGDPFAKLGLFATTDVKPWRQGFGVKLA